MPWEPFIKEIGDWLEARQMTRPGIRWVLGVSGGADSTLLLHAMHSVSAVRNLGWGLCVAHLHHGLRDRDADEDAIFVAQLAKQFDLPFHEERADIRAQVAAGAGSTEEVAREHRYSFLERVALKFGAELCAVAHHADDNAETILHRIIRGTGLRGLAGMRDIRQIQPGSRVQLVRPFLQQTRKTIETICKLRNISWRSDASNDTLEFTRGKIRNAVLPQLRQMVNPNVSESLLRLAEQARWLGTYLEDAAARTFESLLIAEQPGQIVLNTRALLAKQRIVQAEVIRLAISLVLGGEQELGFTHIEAVLNLAEDRSSGKEIHLPGPAVVRKIYDQLEFRPLTDSTAAPPELSPVFVVAPGRTALPLIGYELHVEYCDVDEEKINELRRTRHPYEEWLDVERVQFPLFVRGRREGDRFWPLGAPGSKSLGDFFSDEKLPPALRAKTGVLCDQAGPIWVMPLRIDERVKLRPTTRRALRFMLSPLNGKV